MNTNKSINNNMNKNININKKTIFLITAILIFIVAAGMIAYSLNAIIGSKIRAGERMDEWDDLMAQQSTTESSVPSPTVSTNSPISEIEPTTAMSPAPTTAPKIKYKPTLLGVLTFPTIDNKKVVVVEGTTKADLRGAAGHSTYSALPGRNGNCMIFGHRDGVFIGFAKLKIGDIVKLETVKSAFTYRIISMTIVKPLDPLIKRTYSEPMLTLITCYPFSYVGHAPNRYVVILELVS